MTGNILANYDRMSAEEIGQTVAIGGALHAATSIASHKVPVIGPALAVIGLTYEVGCIFTDN